MFKKHPPVFHGGKNRKNPTPAVLPELQESSFAVWVPGGRVLTWGDPCCAVPLELPRRVQQIEASFAAFAAILVDGTVATWGLAQCGGNLDDPGWSWVVLDGPGWFWMVLEIRMDF